MYLWHGSVVTAAVQRRCWGGAGLKVAAAASWQWRRQSGRRCSGVSAVVAGAAAAAAAWWRRWWRQSGGSAAAAAWRQQRGGGGSAAAARQRAAWQRCWPVRRQSGGGQRCGSVGSTVVVALAAQWRRLAWQLRRKFCGITASAAAADQQELRCRRALPRWQQRHRRQQQWQGHYQQSTIN